MTKLQKDYKHQVNRLRKMQERLESRGYVFLEPIYPKEIPRRVTKKSVSKLKEWTQGDVIAVKAKKVVEETGEIVPSWEYKRIQKYKKQAERGNERAIKQLRDIYKVLPSEPKIEVVTASSTNELNLMVYNNFIEEIYSKFPSNLAIKIESALSDVVSNSSKEEVGSALQEIPKDIIYYLQLQGYDSEEEIEIFMSELVNYLPISDSSKQQIWDVFDEY